MQKKEDREFYLVFVGLWDCREISRLVNGLFINQPSITCTRGRWMRGIYGIKRRIRKEQQKEREREIAHQMLIIN